MIQGLERYSCLQPQAVTTLEAQVRYATATLLGSVLLLSAMGAQAQTMQSGHWSKAQLLERAKKEAEFYLSKEKSTTTARLVRRIRQDVRFELAAVG